MWCGKHAWAANVRRFDEFSAKFRNPVKRTHVPVFIIKKHAVGVLITRAEYQRTGNPTVHGCRQFSTRAVRPLRVAEATGRA